MRHSASMPVMSDTHGKLVMTTSARAASTPAIAEHPVRAALLVSALGVVFGDIGTSPIYAFRESISPNGSQQGTVEPARSI
jgi:K+ transporter